jgi:hypothetical protein
MDIRGIFPSIVFYSVTFSFDEKAQLAAEHFTVQDFFNQVLFFPFNEFWWGRRFRSSSDNWVDGGGSELNYIENRIEAAHGVWQPKAVHISGDLSFDQIRA